MTVTTRHVRTWAVPCRGRGTYLPVCHCGDRHLIPGQSMWDLWWTKWHWGRFLARVLRFSPVSTVPPVLHTRSLLRTDVVSFCQLTAHLNTHLYVLVYRGHTMGKFNRWCQVLRVFLFPISAATVRASMCVRGYICVHAEIPSDF